MSKQINWIKCDEQMPPDDALVILEISDTKSIPTNGHSVNNTDEVGGIKISDMRWTHYTGATWSEVNKLECPLCHCVLCGKWVADAGEFFKFQLVIEVISK